VQYSTASDVILGRTSDALQADGKNQPINKNAKSTTVLNIFIAQFEKRGLLGEIGKKQRLYNKYGM
jgi:hypothetical protein